MDEISINDVVLEAVSGFYADGDVPAMVTGFVLVVSTTTENGDQNIRVSHPDTQGFHQSLGMLAFGEEWVKDDIQMSFIELRDLGE